MRTTVNIPDNCLSEIRKMTGAKTLTEAVNKALCDWVRLMEMKKLKSYRGKIIWEGDLDALRNSEMSENSTDEK